MVQEVDDKVFRKRQRIAGLIVGTVLVVGLAAVLINQPAERTDRIADAEAAPVAAEPNIGAAISSIAMTPTDWVVLDKIMDGDQICSLASEYADGTKINFMVIEEAWQKDVFLFFASNPGWSISEGEKIGDITIRAPDYQFGAEPQTGNHTFFFGIPSVALGPFLTSAGNGGFKIIRKGTQEVGNYTASNLAQKRPAFERCIQSRFGQKDPFAD